MTRHAQEGEAAGTAVGGYGMNSERTARNCTKLHIKKDPVRIARSRDEHERNHQKSTTKKEA